MQHRTYFIFSALALLVLCLPTRFSHAEKKIPIPKERPKVLNVTQSYLEELANKGEPVSPKNLESIEPQAKPTPSESSAKIVTISDSIPMVHKADVENETLISFPLKPEMVKFDDSTLSFLREYVMPQLHAERNKKIEIRAYATEVYGEEHSKVRISLARALEIRQFLITNGIESKRIKLNTLGDQNSTIDSDDRIDLILKK